ncbi:MAG: efflux RND transporter permease subunit [Bacteroidales bacterium]|nr:efflux RND transporter permease subunit [Bacteroidales bacterium]
MSDLQEKKHNVVREFFLTNIALNNKISVYLAVIVLIFAGLFSYSRLPKELFPEIVIPTVFVQTIYPGNPPVDMENLVTRPIEKELESIKGVKKITSTSSQDVSTILIEFNTNVDIKVALQDVKDAVDNVKSDLPNDLPSDPMVMDLDFTEFPIIYINLSGDYGLLELKKYAEYLEDEIEAFPEISKVDIKGLNEREIQINVDPHGMSAREISFTDIENAVGFENISMASGQVLLGETRRSLRVIGEFTSMDDIRNIIVKHEGGNIVYLKDIAEVTDGFADPKDFARLNKQPVVSLQVVKKGGENLLSATDKIFKTLEDARESNALPANLNVTITNDQSDIVRKQLGELENSMILGIILVVLVLFFFLGGRNAFFVGLAIPLSMFIAFLIFSLIGYNLNMMMIFALILALGMVVDDAIVTTENTFRYVERGVDRHDASRFAVGEVAIPVIASTLTTLMAFFPLLFWKSIIGEFMKYLPVVLIITLGASLLVSLVITPVLTSSFMKSGDLFPAVKRKRTLIIVVVMLILAALFFAAGSNTVGSLLVIFALVGLMHMLFLNRLGRWFYNNFLEWLDYYYSKTLNFVLRGRNPYIVLAGAFILLFFTLFLMGVRQPKVVFFPSMNPQYINILVNLPVGTDITATNKFMGKLEDKVFQVMEPYKPIIKSVLTTVGNGARGENDLFDASDTPHRGLITVTFIDYEYREGVSTWDAMKDLTDALIGKYPGAEISVEKQSEGPPTGKPINLEITGKDFDRLIYLADTIETFIQNAGIQGIEGLKMDLNVGKPEAILNIDRDRARRYGLSTAQIAMTVRTALYGKEISDYKEGEDEYPIQLRLKEEDRNNPMALINQVITFRDPATGKISQVPISAVADFTYSTTYESVRRNDLKRMVTLYSNVIKGYNANEINAELKTLMSSFKMPEGYDFKFTGEQEEQAESVSFLVSALLIALALIMLILVSQFNSVIKPFIIMTSVVLSTIGVFGGIATFKMDFVIIMTGIGLISLAGIVVKNAIVLIDYIDLVKLRKRRELGLDDRASLPREVEVACMVLASKTRLRPVLLTAATTLLGLIPLASGMNIDFISLFENFDANIYFGGDNVAFWGPISWTIIFGLTFSTFLTLLVVPAIYHILWRVKVSIPVLRNKIF